MMYVKLAVLAKTGKKVTVFPDADLAKSAAKMVSVLTHADLAKNAAKMVSVLTHADLVKSAAKMVSVLTYAKTGRRAIQRIINVRVNRLLGVLLVNGLHTRIPMFVAT